MDLSVALQHGPGWEEHDHPPARRWHVLWTRSHAEELVREQLAARGFETFLPMLAVWSTRRGLRRRISIPMFSSYLFLRDELDKQRHVEVRKARGLVRILGERWDRPAFVPDHEVEAIRILADSGVPALPHPFLREGRRVRVVDGPLRGVEGVLLSSHAARGLVVVSVNLLQRSVAAEVDCTAVEPA